VKLKYLFFVFLAVALTLGAYFLGRSHTADDTLPAPSFINPRTLDKYTIENLSKAQINASQIVLGNKLSDANSYSSYVFSFLVDADLDQRAPRKVTGLINLPKGERPFGVILMLRGYVDQETYTTGAGTKRAGEYFAQNGFITLAPDFLGYAGSDKEADNIFEARFQTYVTALTLIKSLPGLSGWDGKNVMIWGHSNGGQIALTVLETSHKAYPTVLWAPVSKPFPYSVLYYTDESDDGGKLIRTQLANFEELYDVQLYSLTNYFDRIEAPIQLHQGALDQEVPKIWSDELEKNLEGLDIEIEYILHPSADHNLNPSWESAVEKSLNFFRKYLIKPI
jgi:dipeptidyl aminopeptidase/acylaminoacyl peptidase